MSDHFVKNSGSDPAGRADRLARVDWDRLRAELFAEAAEPLTTSRRLAELIAAAIRASELVPGSRLRETELAAALGASRTPLREALQGLRQQGLVEHDNEGGLRVRVLSWRDVTELYELRASLEGMSARLAARNASAAEAELIAQLNATEQERMRAAAPPQELAQLNHAFHQAILNGARNAFLQNCLTQQNQILSLLGPTAFSLPDRLTAISDEHQAVCTAILNRDEAGAAQVMEQHLHNALTARLGLLSEQITAKDD